MTYVDRRASTSKLIRRLYAVAVVMMMLTVAQITAAVVGGGSTEYVVRCPPSVYG